MLGLAIGDALGSAVEFCPRGSFAPVTSMIGGGPFCLKAGEWTDDTSLALCIAESIAECHGFDLRDQMERFQRWRHEGHLSSNGRCFDIGIATAAALRRFESTGDPVAGCSDPWKAGNGSIMRLAPVPIYAKQCIERTTQLSRESSRSTHGAEECLDACHLLGVLLHHLLNDTPRAVALELLKKEIFNTPTVRAIAAGHYRLKAESEIQTTGYVIHTLEAALWSFERTDSFTDAVLSAVNLGGDADTTGAVCGQIAGACYGIEGIPMAWLGTLAKRDLIEELVSRVIRARECV